MKNIVFSTILGVLIFYSTPVFSQIDGSIILKMFDVSYQSRYAVSTADGIYITAKDSENKYHTYVYKNGSLSEIDSLKNFVVLAYSSSKNLLILGYKPKGSRVTDVTSTQIFSYHPKKSLTKLADFGVNGYSGIYHISVEGDTVKCIVNTKNSDGIGSTLQPKHIVL